LVDITGNSFNKSGDQSYGGGVQIEVWVPGQTTAIVLKRNVLKDIGGSFAFRINNTSLTGTETWSVEAHYNAFFDSIQPLHMMISSKLFLSCQRTHQC
jgi:hypothetical protein